MADAFAENFLMPASGLNRRFSDIHRSSSQGATLADILNLAALYRVAVQALVLRLETLRRLPGGTWERLVAEGFEVRKAQRLLGIEANPPIEALFPQRYVALAVTAFRRGDLTEGQLARYLWTDRLSARMQAEPFQGRIHQEAGGDFTELELDLTQRLESRQRRKMAGQPLALDASTLLNLLASGAAEGTLRAQSVPLYVVSAVASEVLYIRSERTEEPPEQVSVEPLIRSDLLEPTEPESHEEATLFVEFASSVDDGEATSLAVCVSSGYALPGHPRVRQGQRLSHRERETSCAPFRSLRLSARSSRPAVVGLPRILRRSLTGGHQPRQRFSEVIECRPVGQGHGQPRPARAIFFDTF